MIVACIHLHSSLKFRKWLQLLSSILREPKFYHLLVCWRWASSDTPHNDLVTHRQLTSQSCHWSHCDVQLISTSLHARPYVSSLCLTWPYYDLVYIVQPRQWTLARKLATKRTSQTSSIKSTSQPAQDHPVKVSMAHLNNYLRKLASSAIWLPNTWRAAHLIQAVNKSNLLSILQYEHVTSLRYMTMAPATWSSPLPSDSPQIPDELRIWSKQWTNQTCWAYFNLSM